MKEVDDKRNRRDVYKIISRKDSLFGLPFINNENTPNIRNLMKSPPASMGLDIDEPHQNNSPKELKFPENTPTQRQSLTSPGLHQVSISYYY